MPPTDATTSNTSLLESLGEENKARAQEAQKKRMEDERFQSSQQLQQALIDAVNTLTDTVSTDKTSRQALDLVIELVQQLNATVKDLSGDLEALKASHMQLVKELQIEEPETPADPALAETPPAEE